MPKIYRSRFNKKKPVVYRKRDTFVEQLNSAMFEILSGRAFIDLSMEDDDERRTAIDNVQDVEAEILSTKINDNGQG